MKGFYSLSIKLVLSPLCVTAFDRQGKRYLYKRGITVGNVIDLINWIFYNLKDITHINVYGLRSRLFYGRIYPTYSKPEILNIIQKGAYNDQ